jgi:acetolactate synthase-1/3 small subunit
MENNMEKLYTVIIYTENQTGLLQQFTNIFTRHNLDIWSLFASPSAISGYHKLTIETKATEDKIALAVKQIEKKIEVMRAYYYSDDELLFSVEASNKLDNINNK